MIELKFSEILLCSVCLT